MVFFQFNMALIQYGFGVGWAGTASDWSTIDSSRDKVISTNMID